MLERIEPAGAMVSRCTLPGESLEDGVYPAHPSICALSANRWLLLYATRGVRCQDDDMSIVYQVRADAPTGPVLREGFVAPNAPAVTDDELGRFGIYHARLHYREAHPPAWQFDSAQNG